MDKTISYIVMIIGLALVALPLFFKNIADQIPLLSQNIIVTVIAGLLLIVAGFFFLKPGKIKHASEEVPIYQGSGKKRRIVGYRKD